MTIQKVINNIFGEDLMSEQWPDRDSIEFSSLHGDETCHECGIECDDEYCKSCAPHMKS